MRGRSGRLTALLFLVGEKGELEKKRAIAWLIREMDISSISARAMIGDMRLAGYMKDADGMLTLTAQGKARVERHRKAMDAPEIGALPPERAEDLLAG